MFNPDKPIVSYANDILGRKDFAKAVSKTIYKDSNKDSYVIAFYGKWGSGKTSLINMILENIENETKDMNKDKKPIVVKFNPWIFSNQHQLVTQFFNHLSNVLGREDNSKWLKDSANWLKIFSKSLAPLALVPGIGTVAFVTSTASSVVGEAAEGLGTQLEKDLQEIKDEIHKILELNEQRIIVVIDDIDRLNKTEIGQIFQLVKSLADFPNTTYILTFDRDIVSTILDSEQCGYGKQYLEKIVQIPFELPTASKSGLDSKLNDGLMKVIKNNPHDDFDKVHWVNISSLLTNFFANIRDINRYINILSFNYELIKEEVNVIDFIAITAIQVFLPEVYTEIKENKEVFVGTMSAYDNSRKEVDKLICANIIEKSEGKYHTFIQAFLTELFPRLMFLYNNTSYSSDFLQSWRKHRYICSEDIFDAYFRLALPEGKISQTEIDIFLSPELNDVVKISRAFTNIKDDSKILDFLAIFPIYAKDMPHKNIDPFITMILDYSDLLPEDNSTLYGTPLRIHWITSSLLKQIETQEERFNVLKNAIQNSNQSLYTIVWLLDFQDDLHGKYGYKEPETPESKLLIDSNQLQELEHLICSKINQWAEDGRLIQSSHMYTILKLWERWDYGKKHQEVIGNIVSNNISFSKLITSMLSPRVTASETIWKIDIDSLKELTGLDDVKERISKIKESSDYDALSKNQKDALDICLKEIDLQIGQNHE